jgi:hypothetical protein
MTSGSAGLSVSVTRSSCPLGVEIYILLISIFFYNFSLYTSERYINKVLK